MLGILFLYKVGVTRSATASATAADLLSLVSTVAIVYTLATVMKQRVQRDRLIDELRVAHVQLQEAHQQLQLAAARDIELAALRERNRLAREMHDSLGHALVLIAVKIEAGQRLQAIDPARAAAEWEDTKALVRSTMSELRSSLAGLRLPVLDEMPFGAALAELASDLGRRTGIEVAVDVADEAGTLDRTAQETLYRVAQEALTNVAKHARARHTTLTLALRDGMAWLAVEDDGVGLGAAPRSGYGHYGVQGMRERIEALGGVLTLGPRAGGGTVLRASLQLEEGAGVRDPHPVG
jgi:signal transduction histidine kinase